MPGTSNFKGTYTAIVTPFRNGKIDDAALVKLLEEQISGGIAGVVPVGTTGESPTLSTEEHLQMISRTVEIVNKRIKVIAGAGSNSTEEAVHLTEEAERRGADGVLLVAPYYNKPSQAGLIAHFSKIADASRLPIILYSIPGRCGIEIGVETVATLAKTKPTIVGIKEAGGTVERVSQLRQALPDTFAILSGDDSLTLPFMSVGAVGVISVASNFIPGEVTALVHAALEGNYNKAEKLHRKYYPLFRDFFIEPNPVPVKFAMARKGWMTPDVRLPLVPMQPKTQAQLEATLKQVGL
jgi:4-hydroxy-tetrahydrodipicolinate synthase